MVLPIRTYSKSGVSANAWNSRCQTPACDQRRNRACTPLHLPNTSGRSRQRAALATIQRTASTNNRLLTPLRPRVLTRPGRCLSIRLYCASVSVRLLMAQSSQALNQITHPHHHTNADGA